jgi:hypothetical protein
VDQADQRDRVDQPDPADQPHAWLAARFAHTQPRKAAKISKIRGRMNHLRHNLSSAANCNKMSVTRLLFSGPSF